MEIYHSQKKNMYILTKKNEEGNFTPVLTSKRVFAGKKEILEMIEEIKSRNFYQVLNIEPSLYAKLLDILDANTRMDFLDLEYLLTFDINGNLVNETPKENKVFIYSVKKCINGRNYYLPGVAFASPSPIYPMGKPILIADTNLMELQNKYKMFVESFGENLCLLEIPEHTYEKLAENLDKFMKEVQEKINDMVSLTGFTDQRFVMNLMNTMMERLQQDGSCLDENLHIVEMSTLNRERCPICGKYDCTCDMKDNFDYEEEDMDDYFDYGEVLF